MKKYALWSGLLLLSACSGSPREDESAAPRKPDKQALFRGRGLLAPNDTAFNAELEAYAQHNYAREFKAGVAAKIIVTGKKAPFLALYAFDPDGNCVGHDDEVEVATPNEVAVEWIPSRKGLYSAAVQSLARSSNEYLMALRSAPAP
jgi:hypothetical protein